MKTVWTNDYNEIKCFLNLVKELCIVVYLTKYYAFLDPVIYNITNKSDKKNTDLASNVLP